MYKGLPDPHVRHSSAIRLNNLKEYSFILTAFPYENGNDDAERFPGFFFVFMNQL